MTYVYELFILLNRKEVFFGNVADQLNVTCAVDRQLDRATIHLKTPLVVKDDIKFMFYSSEVPFFFLLLLIECKLYFIARNRCRETMKTAASTSGSTRASSPPRAI